MVRRFGLEPLADAVNRIKYPGLDLSNILWTVPGKSCPLPKPEIPG